MINKLLFQAVIFFIFIILFPGRAFAQSDPNTIKLKSFTPAPTRTPVPTRTPTITPRVTPSAGITTVNTQPTIAGSNSACYLSNRGLASDCAVVGKSLVNPKPRYLKDTSLCTEAYMYPYYRASFEPPNLVNLHDAIGRDFWVRNTSIMYNACKVDDLRRLLTYVEKNFNCISFVGYGYRSYDEQSGLWDGKNCTANPNCGVAPPGRSLHQGGIAVDLFCMKKVGSAWVLENIPDAMTAKARDFNFSRPIPGFDPPHFNGL